MALDILSFKEGFDRTVIVGAIFATGVGVWYLMKKVSWHFVLVFVTFKLLDNIDDDFTLHSTG